MLRLTVVLATCASICLTVAVLVWLAPTAPSQASARTAGFTPTSTPTAVVTPTPQACVVIQGSITMSDSIQTGMLNQVGTPSVCTFNPRPDPGQADTLQRHRDIYLYHFPFGSFSTQCVTVNIAPAGCPGNLFSAAYVNGAYAGDLGTVPSGGGEYSFTVFRGQPFSVVVHEVTPDTGCSSYTLTLSSNIPCSNFSEATPTPTWASTWTPIATATGTPTGGVTTAPTQSPTGTPTLATQTPSPTATSTACTVVDYTYSVTPISPDGPAEGIGTSLLDGPECSGCTVPVSLPFPFAFYGHTYDDIVINTHGIIQFTSLSSAYHTCPLPIPELGPAMLAYWSEFELTWGGGQPDPCMQNYGISCGVYTSTSGKSPNRVFNVHWVGVLIGSNHETVNFEARLHETTGVFDFVYHTGIQFGDTGSIGIQDGASRFTSYACNTSAQLHNIQVRWTPVLVPCPSATPTRTPTQSPTVTRTATNTPRPPTQTPGSATATQIPTGTIPPTASATPMCALKMADVLPGSTFYPYVRCLTCKGIIGGYPCGGQGEPCNSAHDPYFRPNNGITRGQIAKIVSEAAGFIEDAGPQTYEDVPPGSPFYVYINRLSNRGLVGGYPCGQMPDEPCVSPGNRPYFRPNTGATRGQLAKIVATPAGINDPVSGQFYADVPTTNPFYVWVERLTSRGVMGGYPCGSSPGEPCDAGNRPYFRWAADITRGQASKIVTNTFFPGCEVLERQ